MRLFLASSNPGKLREYLELARGSGVTIELLPRFGEFPSFEESAPTFAENSAGKALHYSRFTDEAVLADDSGLVVPALGWCAGGAFGAICGAGRVGCGPCAEIVAGNARQGRARAARAICLRDGCGASRAGDRGGL